METFSNLYGIFGQNNEHNYANENENHLPEFLQSVNNGSSSLSVFNLENEEFGLNSETRLLVARLLVAPQSPRRSSPRRSSPWDIFNRNCHNLCRILPAQVIKLLHVPILWMRPDFQWCHKKKSMKFAKEAQAKTPHAQPKHG